MTDAATAMEWLLFIACVAAIIMATLGLYLPELYSDEVDSMEEESSVRYFPLQADDIPWRRNPRQICITIAPSILLPKNDDEIYTPSSYQSEKHEKYKAYIDGIESINAEAIRLYDVFGYPPFIVSDDYKNKVIQALYFLSQRYSMLNSIKYVHDDNLSDSMLLVSNYVKVFRKFRRMNREEEYVHNERNSKVFGDFEESINSICYYLWNEKMINVDEIKKHAELVALTSRHFYARIKLSKGNRNYSIIRYLDEVNLVLDDLRKTRDLS